MAIVILVQGKPGDGKSTLARMLKEKCNCYPIGVDGVYVKFLQEKCNELFFPMVKSVIYNHYRDLIVKLRNHWKIKLGRDLVAEWNNHLIDHIKETSATCDRIVVEGWHLSLPNFTNRRSALNISGIKAIDVFASKFKYTIDGCTYSQDNAVMHLSSLF